MLDQPVAVADWTATSDIGPTQAAIVAGIGDPALAEDAGTSSLPSFPGAEGFGAVSVGGRGGRVIHVTTLAPTGPGSLNEATRATGPRIIVFDVSGVITGDVLIKDGNLTIAGQTAPGAGITIEGRLISQFSNWDLPADDPRRLMFHDLIVRHIRVRPPQPGGVNGDCIQLSDWDRVILDHVSVAWGNDENIDLCGTRDLTVQWSTIEESDKYYQPEGDPRHVEGVHNYGMITGYAGKDISIHHNLFAHQMMRTPLDGAEPLDHRNNVIYDVDQGLSFHPPRMNYSRPDQPIAANVIGNYWAEGPSAPKNGIDTYVNPAIDTKYSWIYTSGNYFDYLNYGEGGYLDLEDFRGVTWLDKSQVGTYDSVGVIAQEPFLTAPADPTVAIPPVATQDARVAYALVLQYAGSFPHDTVTTRTFQEVRTKTGSFGKHFPAGGLMEGLTPGTAPVDTDQDGMPDVWEQAHGLDPSNPSDRNEIVPLSASSRHAGYTWVEFYLNDLSDQLTGMDRLQYPGIIAVDAGEMVTSEGGRSASFAIVLKSRPTADVKIDLVSSDTSEGVVSPAQLVFTPDNWDVPQTAVVTGVDDGLTDGDVPYTIVRGPATSDDLNYAGLEIESLSLTNIDDDAATVAGRYVFYNQSAFDGDDAAANVLDDSAIALDKEALMPGETASFANYTSYFRGINGIVVDVARLADPAALSADDFQFHVGNNNDPNGWTVAPAPSVVAVRLGAGSGGSDRITLVWPDGAIADRWLQVTVLANNDTGLAEPDVFYFGNAIGDGGNQPGNAIVNATDEILTQNFHHGELDPAEIDDRYDYNRDGLVNGTDQIIARDNQTNPLSMLRLITVPPVQAKAAAAASDLLEPSLAELDWLYELQQVNRRNAKRTSPAETAVDVLLATYW